jgi:hypothetical protein
MKIGNVKLGDSVPFTQVSNEFLRNPNISARAKGLMCYLWANSDDWVIVKEAIPNFFKDGRDSIRTAWSELEKLGYIVGVAVRNEKGQLKGWDYTVYHYPNKGDTNIAVSNSGLPNTNNTINNNNNTNNKNSKINISFDLFWNAYDKKTGRPKSEKKWNALNDTERTAIMEYIPKYVKSQPEKMYRKNPETFFNNRGWEDELIGADGKAIDVNISIDHA